MIEFGYETDSVSVLNAKQQITRDKISNNINRFIVWSYPLFFGVFSGYGCNFGAGQGGIQGKRGVK
jgi:hypothetical protein